VQTLSWWIKVSNVILLFFSKKYAEGRDIIEHGENIALAFSMCLVLSLFLPSIIFVVRNREQTTKLIIETIVMFQLCIKCLDYTNHKMLMLQFCLCHIFFSLGKSLLAHKYALLYSSFIANMSFALGFVFSIICSTQIKFFSISLFDGISVLFAGEVMGCLTFLFVSALEFCGNSYEKIANANLN
jgi:hypothetical protein